jgi:hypothetical protein
VVLEYPCDGLFTDIGGLLGRRHGLEQITSASRLSSLAPETVKRSRKRSSCLGLTE